MASPIVYAGGLNFDPSSKQPFSSSVDTLLILITIEARRVSRLDFIEMSFDQFP